MKKMITTAAAVLLAITLTACSSAGSNDTVTIDMDQLAEALLETVTSDSLTQTAEEMVTSIYSLDDDIVEKAVAETSSGATACEVTIIESKQASDTADVEEQLQYHVDVQEELYSSYNQSEAARLETAIIKSAGVYTVLVVCDDPDAAEAVLKEYGF